jgi:uncharacterized protein YjiS (DUF1127 family)
MTEKYSIQRKIKAVCMQIICVFWICNGFAARPIMKPHEHMMRSWKMNGLSDVRLALYSQELVNGQARSMKGSYPSNLSRWALFQHRRATRRALLSLTADQLKDIGLTREQAREEGLKPFWRE